MSINQRVSVAGALAQQRRSFRTAFSHLVYTVPRPSAYLLLIAGLTGAGLCARFVWMPLFPFREDEAIYAYWALHGLHADPWFLQVWPDKPPLFYGLLALLFALLGDSDSIVRGLNIAASMATIVIVAMTARRLWNRFAGVIAALALALNPLAISFAPTGYTDPLLVLFGALAVYCACVRAGLWAGLCLGAALMTKQQGILYAPLVLGLLLLAAPPASDARQLRTAQGRFQLPILARFVAGLFVIVGPVLYWDSLRWAVAPSPWDQAVQNYSVLALLSPDQWLAQLWQWRAYIRYIGGGWTGWVWLSAVACVVLWRRFRYGLNALAVETTTFLEARSFQKGVERRVLWMLALWSVTFLLAHTLTSMQIWDRYLLPLAPVLALIAGGMAHLVVQGRALVSEWRCESAALQPRAGRTLLPIGWHALLAGALLLCLLPSAQAAARGALPLGGDHGEYAGLTQVLAYVHTQVDAPPAAGSAASRPPMILYHRALGWHYQYYLYEEIQSGRIDPRWFPHTVYLVNNAGKSAYLRKLLVVPAWAPISDLSLHLATRGLRAHELMRAGNFVLLELSATARPVCGWCLCVRPFITSIEPITPHDPESRPPMSQVRSP